MPPWVVNDNHGSRLTGHQTNEQTNKKATSAEVPGRLRVAGAGRKVTQWPGRKGRWCWLHAEHGPSAGGRGCQHKLTQVVLAPGLEQHRAVFSLLCSTLLHWDNVRFLILYAEGRKNSTFSFFFFLNFSVSPLYLSLCVVVLQGQVSKYFIPVTSFCAKVTRGGHE